MTQPVPRRRPSGCVIALGVAAVIFIIVVAASLGSGGSAPTSPGPAVGSSAPTSTTEATTAPPTQSGPLTTFGGDGTYRVGTDIAAGTYRSAGPAPDGLGLCSWFRLKDTTGNDGTIIAFSNSKGPLVVTIGKSDGAFQTSGCQQWNRVGS